MKSPDVIATTGHSGAPFLQVLQSSSPTNILGIDHIVLACADLELAASAAASMGFTVGEQNDHVIFRTSNRLVVFDESYIELLAIAGSDPDQPWVQKLLRSCLARGGGMTMTALATDDATSAYQAFHRRGVDITRPHTWSRTAATETGVGLARFTTMQITSSNDTALSFFVCQQHTPEMVWRPSWKKHRNSTYRLLGVQQQTMDFESDAAELTRIFGSDVSVDASMARVQIGGQHLAICRPTVFERTLGRSAVARSPQSAIITVEVRSLESAREACSQPKVVDLPERLIVEADGLPGVYVEFVVSDA